MSNEVEIWKDIPNYEGHYKVSSLGRVKNSKTNNFIKFNKQNSGYLYAHLFKNNFRKSFLLHQLVAMAFLGHKPDGYKIVVDHIDNNKLNNRLDNLQLISQRENASKYWENSYGKQNSGVCFDSALNKYKSYLFYNKRIIHLGYCEKIEDAICLRVKALAEIEQGLDLNTIYPKRIKTSKYVGVFFDKTTNNWKSKYKGKLLGVFKTEEQAYSKRLQILNK